MPDSLGFDEYDLGNGQTVRLPATLGPYIGLPRASSVDHAPPVRPPQHDDPVAGAYDNPAMRARDERVRGVAEFFSPEAEARRAAAPEFWSSPTGKARLLEMAKRKEEVDARNAQFQALNDPGYGLPDNALAQAHIGQSMGPVGTIGQIGDGALPGGGIPIAADVGSLSRDLAAATPPVAAPSDPKKPELAGLDQQQQGLAMQGQAAQQTAAADAAQGDAEMAAISERNTRLEQERQKAAQDEQRWLQRRKEIEDKVATDTDRWAEYKIDPGRRWKNMSTGRKIGAAISVAMTALGDALQHKNGPNLAIEMISKSIEDDVNLQVQERQHLGDVASRSRTSLDDYRRNYGDWKEARALKLAEEYKRTADEIERIAAGAKTERAKANGLAMAGEFRGRAGALENGVAQAGWNREMNLAKFAEEKRHAKATEGIARAGQKQEADQFAERMKFEYAKLDAEAAKATADGNAKKAKDILERGVPAPPAAVLDAEGNPTGELNRNTGTLILENALPEEAKEARHKMAVANELIDVIDEIVSIRSESGGATAALNSDAYQRLSVLQNKAATLAKDGTQGLSSENDMKLVIGAAGTDDVTSFRDQAAKLAEARARIVKSANGKLHSLGYKGNDITWADPNALKAKTNAQQADFQQALQTPVGADPNERYKGMSKAYVDAREGPDAAVRYAKARAATATTIGNLIATATNQKLTPKKRDEAREMLVKGMADGQSKEIKEAFQRGLQLVDMSNIQPSPEAP